MAVVLVNAVMRGGPRSGGSPQQFAATALRRRRPWCQWVEGACVPGGHAGAGVRQSTHVTWGRALGGRGANHKYGGGGGRG